MGRVADQQSRPAQVPETAPDGSHRADGVFAEFFFQLRYERRRVRKIERHERLLANPGIQFFESPRHAMVAFAGQEKHGRKAAVDVGHGDHHVAAPRPHVERVRVQRRLALRAWGYRQLLVAGVQHFLRDSHARCPLHAAANAGSRAVRAEQDLEVQLTGVVERQRARAPVDGLQRLAEVDADLAGRLCCIQQAADQPLPADAVQGLVGVNAVGLQCRRTASVVDHAAAHGSDQLADRVLHAGQAQGVAATFTEREDCRSHAG